MEPITWVAASWASGINAYLTVLIIGLAGQFGWVDAPDTIQRPAVLIVAGVMFAIEFVADKIALIDSAWDLAHLLIRPAIGGWLGSAFAAAELGRGQAFAAAAGLALVGHLTKSSSRLAINLSPEPVTNVIASFAEDGLVSGLVALALVRPGLAAAVACVGAALGVILVIVIWRLVRRGWRRVRTRLATDRRSIAAGSPRAS